MPTFDKEKFTTWAKGYIDYDALSYKATEAFTDWSPRDPNVWFNKMRAATDVVEEVINLLEKFSNDVDDLSSREKLDLAVEFLDDIIKFNFLIEAVDGMIIRTILSTIVMQKNKHLGSDWIKKIE